MPVPQKLNVITRVDMDSDETQIQPDSVAFLKGWTGQVSTKPSGEQGFNRGVATPREGSLIQTDLLTLPDGENFCIGSHEALDLNEAYIFCWNSRSDHFIYRVNGSDGTAQMVYRNSYLKFRLDPKYYICEGRCTVKSVTIFNKQTQLFEQRKFLIFIDYTEPRMISVEDAIATSSFDHVQFPYYTPMVTGQSAIDAELEKYINLAVPTPMDCISVVPQKRLDADKGKQNLMLYKGWQWRVKFIDVYGRESEHGVISDRFFTVIGSNCIGASSELSRCVRLKFGAGNPLTDKIQVEFRSCNTNADLSTDSDWYLYDTISKYNDDSNVPYWMRPVLNPWQKTFDDMTAQGATPDQIEIATQPLTKYNVSDNTFEYTFCGDKQCGLIAIAETNRTENNIPKHTSTIFALREGIGMANNRRGYEPVPASEIEKIKMEVVAPVGGCDDFTLRKIVLYLVIVNADQNFVGGVCNIQTVTAPAVAALDGCNAVNPPSYPHTCIWGNLDSGKRGNSELKGQYFPVEQEGFRVYLAGTNYSTVTKQILIDVLTMQEYPIGTFDHNGSPTTTIYDKIPGVLVQKAEFSVPPGRYIARVCAHRAKVTEDYQATSTYVTGRVLFSNFVNGLAGVYGTGGPTTHIDSRVKEMAIDCSIADYRNTDDAFKVLDTVWDRDSTDPDEGSVHDGMEMYVKEDEISRVPIALAQIVDAAHSGGPNYDMDIERFTPMFTDHNGFWFSTKNQSYSSRFVTVLIQRCDAPDPQYPYYLGGYNWAWGKVGCAPSPTSMETAVCFLYGGLNRMPDVNRRVIKGKVKMCDKVNGISIPGVPIVPYYLQPAITNSDGEFTIITHGRMNTFDSPLVDQLIVSQNVCQYNDCDDPCDFSFPTINVPYQDCTVVPRVWDMTPDPILLNVRGVNLSGPQNGGRYQVGVIFHDGKGRHDFVQTADHLIVNIPSMIDTKTFAHSNINFRIDSSFLAPEWAQYMTFAITDNLNWSDFFMWSADRIVFVDGAGYENATTPTKVRIYYESMIEYQKQNNLKTNTIWQFITTENDSVVGDVIEFIRNGDGTWATKNVTYAVRYDKEGTYIEIQYDAALKDLKAGTLFKVMRPKTCVDAEIFREVCPVITLVDRMQNVLTGTLQYRDSFFLTRQFPVPEYKIDPADATKSVKTVSVRTSFYMYEHHSPSDVWGNHCWTRGRIFFKNPYEHERHLPTEVALSKPLINKSSFNGLSYYDLEDITRFDEQEWGSITVVLVETNTCLMLCKRNNFLVGFSDNALRVDATGNVYTGSQLGKFGQPQRKIGQNYGCQEIDVNTIRKYSGVVVFVDRGRGELVFHMFSQALDVSVTGFKGWLRMKLADQNQNNRQPTRIQNKYFVGGIDTNTKEYYLTSVKMTRDDLPFIPTEALFHLEDWDYVNTTDAVSIGLNETIAIDLTSASMKGFCAFTPEYYARMEGFFMGNNTMAMRRGHGWSLHTGIGTVPYNNFFGTQTKKIIEYLINISPEKVKRFMYLEVYNTAHKLFASLITTEAGQRSVIPASWFDQFDNFFASAFLCDVFTPADPNLPNVAGVAALYEGEPLMGRWARVRLESADADDPNYCELSAIVSYVIPSGKSADT